MGVSARGRVELAGLTKTGSGGAVDAVDLEIAAGEFFAVLGPPGSGKTALLRLVAGLDRPTSGTVRLDGLDAAKIRAHRRRATYLGDNLELPGSQTIEEAVSSRLRRERDQPSKEQRLAETLDLVGLHKPAGTRIRDLDETQRLRVALGRALAPAPAVVVLDNVLGAVDAAVRHELITRLREIQERAVTTFVYATRDERQALGLADRIAVMSAGAVAQVGSPLEVYEEPVSAHVAAIVGPANLLSVDVISPGGMLRACEVRLVQAVLSVKSAAPPDTDSATLCIRPERVGVAPADHTGMNHLPGTVERAVFYGAMTDVWLRLAEGVQIRARLVGSRHAVPLTTDSPVSVYLPPDGMRLLPA
jgi:ABC-type Fe3+/spermidine/putrescine transport system ATPase subunit